MKTLTNEDLAKHAAAIGEALTLTQDAYKSLARLVPIRSEVFQSVCSAGKKLQRSYWTFRREAEDRGWTTDEINKVFVNRITCGFS